MACDSMNTNRGMCSCPRVGSARASTRQVDCSVSSTNTAPAPDARCDFQLTNSARLLRPRLRKEEGFVRDETATAPSQRAASLRPSRPDNHVISGGLAFVATHVAHLRSPRILRCGCGRYSYYRVRHTRPLKINRLSVKFRLLWEQRSSIDSL